jgi:hypothetical protein
MLIFFVSFGAALLSEGREFTLKTLQEKFQSLKMNILMILEKM